MRKIYILMAAAALLMVGCKNNGGKKGQAEPAPADSVAAVAPVVSQAVLDAIEEYEAEEEVEPTLAIVEKLSALDAEGMVEGVAEALERDPNAVIPFAAVENKPSFNGGDVNNFSTWVNEHIVYPQEAIDQNLQGRVVVSFTVSKEGKVENVNVLRGVDPALDNAAVTAVASSPDWEPGNQNGIPVAVNYVFPVVFKLQ